MKQKFIFRILIFTALSIIFIGSLGTSSSQPYIGEDDEYIKEVEINTEGKFFWTIYKNSSTDYSVTVNVDGLSEWSTEIVPQNFILSDDKSYEVIILNIKVPKYPDVGSLKGSINFVYRPLNSSEKNTIQKDFEINIVGIYEGRENTIFGGFKNPLPEPFDNSYGALIINILIWLILLGYS